MKKNIFANNYKKVLLIGLIALLVVSGFFVLANTALTAPPPVRNFSASISPTSTGANNTQLYTITITNDVSSNKTIKSAKVFVPTSGFSNISDLILGGSVSSSTWTVELKNNVIEMKKKHGGGADKEVNPGESFTVTFNAKAGITLGTYEWITRAWEGENFDREEFTITSSQPLIEIINTPPILNGVPATTTINELEPYSFTASATDPDSPPQTLTFSLVGAPNGATINPSTGEFSWTPSEEQGPGIYTFIVRVSDGTTNTDASITITVNEVNTPPVAKDSSVSTLVNTPVDIGMIANDEDLPVNILTYEILSGPSSGSLSQISGNHVTYTPGADYVGPDSFTFRVVDNYGGESTATVSIIVSNEAPVLSGVPSNVSVDEGSSYTFTASATDPDSPPQTLTFSLVGAPNDATINPSTGEFSWTPSEEQGPGIYTFAVQVTDGVYTNSETITIEVKEVNSNPIANDQTITTDENTPISVQLSATDSDLPANALTYSIKTGPTNGTISNFDSATGELTYTPSNNYSGSDSFTFKANDGTADSNIATISITVNAKPAPIISDEAAEAQVNSTSITVTWKTDHPATSRVIYDTVSHPDPLTGLAPKYGYAFTTEETDTLPMVTDHIVVISGLNPTTTYYFRSVSRGSPEAVSTEFSATTGNIPSPAPAVTGNSYGGGGYSGFATIISATTQTGENTGGNITENVTEITGGGAQTTGGGTEIQTEISEQGVIAEEATTTEQVKKLATNRSPITINPQASLLATVLSTTKGKVSLGIEIVLFIIFIGSLILYYRDLRRKQ